MKKVTIALAAVASLALVGVDSNTADAAHGYGGFGIHLGGRNVHFDIGSPHGYRSYNVYRGRQSSHHNDWHDTSHVDYHPASYQRHYNHYDNVPAHLDYNQTGHWDGRRSYRRW